MKFSGELPRASPFARVPLLRPLFGPSGVASPGERPNFGAGKTYTHRASWMWESRRRCGVRLRVITPDRGAGALADLAELPLNRYPLVILLPRIWELRDNFTAYDAAYLALAEAIDATLITRDRALASVRGNVRVEVV